MPAYLSQVFLCPKIEGLHGICAKNALNALQTFDAEHVRSHPIRYQLFIFKSMTRVFKSFLRTRRHPIERIPAQALAIR